MNDLERTRLEAELKATKEYARRLETILEKTVESNRKMIRNNDMTVRIVAICAAVFGVMACLSKVAIQFWS